MNSNIAIVSGSDDGYEIFYSLNFLNDCYNITGFTENKYGANWQLPYKVKVFGDHSSSLLNNHSLVELLRKFDLILILGVETSKSIAICNKLKKLNKTLWLYYSKYKTINKTKSSNCINNKIDISCEFTTFFVPHNLCKNELINLGINSHIVFEVGFNIEEYLRHEKTKKTNKFRGYMGWSDEECLFLYKEDKENRNFTVDLLKSLKALKRLLGDLKTPKIIIVIEGGQDSFLKRLAITLGLDSDVVFIGIDFDKIKSELFLSCDFTIWPDKTGELIFPFNLLEAVFLGSVPLVLNPSHVQKEFFAGLDLNLNLPTKEHRKWTEVFLFCVQCKHKNKSSNSKLFINNSGSNLFKKFCFKKQVKFNFPYNQIILRRAVGSVSSLKSKLKLIDSFLASSKYLSDKHKSDVCLFKADVLYSFDMVDESVDNLEKSLFYNIKNKGTYLQLGKISMNCLSYREALIFYKKAIAIDSSLVEACFGIGQVFCKLSLFGESLYWIEKGLILSDKLDNNALGFYLGVCLKLKDTQDSTSSIERVIEAHGEEKKLMLTLGKICMKIPERCAEGRKILEEFSSKI